MATTIQDFVDSIATKAGVDPATAETAIGTILSAIQQEGDATKVGQLFNQIPGAADLAQKHAVVVGSGGGVLGSLSGLASSVVGKDAGVLVAAIGQLEQTNLTMEQIKKIGTAYSLMSKKAPIPRWRKRLSIRYQVCVSASVTPKGDVRCWHLIGQGATSDLSPQGAPKRTLTASRVAVIAAL